MKKLTLLILMLFSTVTTQVLCADTVDTKLDRLEKYVDSIMDYLAKKINGVGTDVLHLATDIRQASSFQDLQARVKAHNMLYVDVLEHQGTIQLRGN